MVVSVVGFHTLAGKVEEYGSKKKVRKYSSRNLLLLRRRMLSVKPMYKDFVTGGKCGIDKYFFCRFCCRDVCIESHGMMEFDRHFGGKGHCTRDMTYRVHLGMSMYTKFLEPMELSNKQRAEYLVRLFVDSGPEYPFP